MPKIQTNCPNCKQPIITEIQQVIDVGNNPGLKEPLLSGGINFAKCQVCGFQGQISVPIVYHDAGKELLYTFSPPDANKTMEEKETALAPLLKKIIDNLTPEERKGYLFQPQAMLSMESLVKNVLLKDGITEEMIQDQQKKIKLLDTLFNQEVDQLTDTVKKNNEEIDREFFAIFAEIAQKIVASQDEKSIKKIQAIQDVLMAETDIGKEIFAETKEIQAASQSLEALGKNLTRGSLLELIISAPSKERVKAITSLARPAMDYEFFQMFTERIEKSAEDIRKNLIEKRNMMLKITQEIDQQVQDRLNNAVEQINLLLKMEPLEEAILQNLDKIDQFFIQALSAELERATTEKQNERKEKLELLLHKIQEISTPVEMKIVEQLMTIADNEEELNNLLEEMEDQISSQLVDYLSSIINNFGGQITAAEEKDKKDLEKTLNQLNTVYKAILRKTMKMKLSE